MIGKSRQLRLSEYAAAGIMDLLVQSGAIERFFSYKPVFGVYSEELVEIFEFTAHWLHDEGLLRISKKTDPGVFIGVMSAKGFQVLERKVLRGGECLTLASLISDHQTTHAIIESGGSGREKYHGFLGLIA